MKVKLKRLSQPKKFIPVEVTFTCETESELSLLYHVCNTANLAIILKKTEHYNIDMYKTITPRIGGEAWNLILDELHKQE